MMVVNNRLNYTEMLLCFVEILFPTQIGRKGIESPAQTSCGKSEERSMCLFVVDKKLFPK